MNAERLQALWLAFVTLVGSPARPVLGTQLLEMHFLTSREPQLYLSVSLHGAAHCVSWRRGCRAFCHVCCSTYIRCARVFSLTLLLLSIRFCCNSISPWLDQCNLFFLFLHVWTFFHTSCALLPMHDLALGTPGDPKSANIYLIQDENCPTAAANAFFP